MGKMGTTGTGTTDDGARLVGEVQARFGSTQESTTAERWWLDWGSEEGDDDLYQPTSLWEAEITALDDEHLLALEENAEDV
jgi:hypothetical protein